MDMDKLVALCRRRGFLFQSSEIYGGLNGFLDYGPLGVELKRNIKEAWGHDMVTGHNELFCDMMVDCRQTKHRYRFDKVRGRWAEFQGQKTFVTTLAENESEDIAQRAQKFFKL